MSRSFEEGIKLFRDVCSEYSHCLSNLVEKTTESFDRGRHHIDSSDVLDEIVRTRVRVSEMLGEYLKDEISEIENQDTGE